MKNKLLALGVIALIAGATYFTMTSASPAEDAPVAGGAPQAMPISTALVIEGEVTDWSEFSGRLRAAQDVQIRPRVSGTIEEVHFKEGDIVKKGDKLFTIDLRPFRAAYAQADAALTSAKAASAEKGRWMVEELTDLISRAVTHEFG